MNTTYPLFDFDFDQIKTHSKSLSLKARRLYFEYVLNEFNHMMQLEFEAQSSHAAAALARSKEILNSNVKAMTQLKPKIRKTRKVRALSSSSPVLIQPEVDAGYKEIHDIVLEHAQRGEWWMECIVRRMFFTSRIDREIHYTEVRQSMRGGRRRQWADAEDFKRDIIGARDQLPAGKRTQERVAELLDTTDRNLRYQAEFHRCDLTDLLRG